MMNLPEGYAVRSATLDDANALSALLNTYMEAVAGRAIVSAESVHRQLGMPGIDCAEDTRVVVAPNKELAAFAAALHVAPHVQVSGVAVVAIPHQGKGIGSELLGWIEERGARAVEMAPMGCRVSLIQGLNENEAAAKALLAAHQYQSVRHFWRMSVEFAANGALQEPRWPEGISVSTLDPAKDLEASLRAARDAFRDHWGHVETPEKEALERMRHRIENDPDFDASLRFLAREGSEIAGVCYARPKDGTDSTTAYIETLGVRRPWRRRGLAEALLRHTFRVCHRRGLGKVALDVDAASLTGATRLYEKVGMHVSELTHAYEKELRAGEELATQDLTSSDHPA
ncbi:GNAT family N-acetyltransferase [Candidatus Bipolaricaulota bacterium]|nr:GNAT family N-acetyltransferase [Candidatus Bipolaricaulota bacterium]